MIMISYFEMSSTMNLLELVFALAMGVCIYISTLLRSGNYHHGTWNMLGLQIGYVTVSWKHSTHTKPSLSHKI